MLFCAVVFVVIVGSYEFVTKNIRHAGEFYSLLLISTLGAIYMARRGELLTAYLSIELLSFSLYVAVSLAKTDPRSGEAGLKYVLLGGVASAMLLYGLSLIYGVAGSTDYAEIARRLRRPVPPNFETAALLGLVLSSPASASRPRRSRSTCGRPTPTRARRSRSRPYLSATSKAAAFALFLALLRRPAPAGHRRLAVDGRRHRGAARWCFGNLIAHPADATSSACSRTPRSARSASC